MHLRNAKKSAPGHYDYWFLLAILLLAGFGVIMVMSSSGIVAEKVYGDKFIFFKKQTIFAITGVFTMFLFSRLPKKLFFNTTYLLLIAVTVLFALVSFTPLGVSAGGAKRWLSMGPFSIQPLEFAKIALVFYLAYFYATKQEKIKSFNVGVIPPFAVTGMLCALLLLQPDFGGAVFLCLLLAFMSFVGGTRVTYLLLSGIIGAMGGWMLITNSAYRLKRWTAFLDPFKSAKDEGYQLVQSLYAFGSGKITGAGLGAGKQKLFFLPEAHNDFIMAVVGEELGFIGMSIVFCLVGFILLRGFRIAIKQEELYNRFTAFGMILVLALGFVLNLAVVLGTVPPKGVPMPFVSYGGSSLLCSFICAGVLLNLSREVNRS